MCRPDNRTVMADAAVAAWTACTVDLHNLMDTGCDVRGDTYKLFLLGMIELQQNPPPKKAWERLAQDVQVTLNDTIELSGHVSQHEAGALQSLCSANSIYCVHPADNHNRQHN